MNYDYMLQAILDYYGSGTDIWSKIELGTATDSDIQFAFSQIPQRQLSVDRTASGYTLGYGYADPIYMDTYKNPILDSVDSNYQTGQYSDSNSFTPRINSTWEYDTLNNEYKVKSGAVSTETGLTLSTIADRASLAVTGINIGAKLGKTIDEAIYNIDPAWWDEHYPSINPQTWSSIAGESSFGKYFFRTLFGIDDNGTTAYIDERVLAQTYQMLRDAGVFDTPIPYSQIQSKPSDFPEGGNWNNVRFPIYAMNAQFQQMDFIYSSTTHYTGMALALSNSNLDTSKISFVLAEGATHIPNDAKTILLYGNTYAYNEPYVIVASKESGWFNQSRSIEANINGSGAYSSSAVGTIKSFTYQDKTVYYLIQHQGYTTINQLYEGFKMSANQNVDTFHIPQYSAPYIAWWTIYGDGWTSQGVPGIDNLPNSTQYPPTNITGTNLNDVLQQLKTEYPDLFSDSIYEDVLQNDGSIDRITYVPIPWASQQNDTEVKPQDQTQPTSKPNTSQDGYVDPQTMTQIFTNPTIPPSDDTTTDVPTTGTGESPITPMVTGSGASMWAIYNPTQAQVDAFGSWLWSSNFVDQLKKLFTDPMGAIIGIHKVFATPVTGETRTIKCGYIDSGVSSKIVTDQYTSIDCGTISLSEYFGSVFDYAPYTSVKCFLPFIGIVSLDVADIMRSKINIQYRVDVLTGACIAEIKVKRDGNTSVLYTFSGSCIVSYPISSGSYAGIVSSVLAVAGGAIASGLTGGLPLLGAAMGAGASLMHAHTDTKINGTFTGSAGAMGGKKPYLIITRPITRMAKYIDKFSGIGANYYMTIGNCEGFFKCNSVHLSISNAYDNELNEIETLLKSGVMMHHEDLEGDYITPPVVMALNANQNGVYDVPIGYYGFTPVTVNVLPILQHKEITSNGNYYPDSGFEGLSDVSVNVQNSYSQADEGKVVSNGQLVAQSAHSEITQNGVYDTTENNSVTVNVSGGGSPDVLLAENAYSTSGSFTYDKSVTIPANGNYTVIAQMFTNSTHFVSINGSNVSVTSSYSNFYVYNWNFTRAFNAGDVIRIYSTSTGSPMVTAIVKAAQ